MVCAGWGSIGTRVRTPADRTRRTSSPSASSSIDRWRSGSSQTATRTTAIAVRKTIQAKREAAEAAGGGWIYDRTCCSLTSDEIAARQAAGTPRAIRFKVPPGGTSFDDLVHGPIAFDNANIEDFVVLRSDRQPTYHLSVVVDDIAMQITHVVRGDDHISNTPKQVLLYRAFGGGPPVRARAADPRTDKKRLSKRHGATSVMEYQRRGICRRRW